MDLEGSELSDDVEGGQAPRTGGVSLSGALPVLVILAVILLSPLLYDLALWLQGLLSGR